MHAAVFPPLAHPSHRHADGHVLLEAVLCIVIVGVAAIPLASLATNWLRWSGQHERLTRALRLAAERAEAGADPWTLASGDSARVSLCSAIAEGGSCVTGHRLSVAVLPAEPPARRPAGAALPSQIALWVSP